MAWAGVWGGSVLPQVRRASGEVGPVRGVNRKRISLHPQLRDALPALYSDPSYVVCTHACVCIRARMCVRMHVHMCACVCVCVCVCVCALSLEEQVTLVSWAGASLLVDCPGIFWSVSCFWPICSSLKSS